MEGIDKNTFKRIFHDHWDAFKQFRPRFDNPDYNETVNKMLDCGNPDKMGFVQYRCCYCGEIRRIAFTCKSCFCLSCAKVYTDRWADFVARRLLPGVTYRHVVLTMPEFLRIWFFRDPTLLSPLMRAGNACLKDIDRAWSDYPKGFVAFLQEAEVPPGGKGLAQYLAKYVVSPPISVRRIESYDGKVISYWYRDHKTGQIKHETLPALQFIGRMAQHILPKGFQRIRYYGLHGNVRYQKMREYLADIIPPQTPDDPRGYRVLGPKPFAQLFFESFGKDPLLCPKCGDNMMLELIYHPK